MLRPLPDNLDWPSSWDAVQAALLERPGVCIVMGDVDTGKSTFCQALADRCVEARMKTAIVDADLGQSRLGPPTTISYQMLPSQGPTAWWFVGDTSPQYRPLATVVGTVRVAQAALNAGAECLLVDTCGWVEGSSAAALKEAKVALLRPRHIVAFQRDDELEPILTAYRVRRDLTVHRLRPSSRVRSRSQERRRQHRQEMFADHFSRAVEHELAFDAVALSGAPILCGRPAPAHVRSMAEHALNASIAHAQIVGGRVALVCERLPTEEGRRALTEAFPEEEIDVYAHEEFRGRLAGVSNPDGQFVALAIVTDIEFAALRLRLLVPRALEAGPVGITLGSVRLASDFSDLGRAQVVSIRPGQAGAPTDARPTR